MPQQRHQKNNYIIICFIKSLTKKSFIIIPFKRTLENFIKFYFYGLKNWVAKCAVCVTDFMGKVLRLLELVSDLQLRIDDL